MKCESCGAEWTHKHDSWHHPKKGTCPFVGIPFDECYQIEAINAAIVQPREGDGKAMGAESIPALLSRVRELEATIDEFITVCAGFQDEDGAPMRLLERAKKVLRGKEGKEG